MSGRLDMNKYYKHQVVMECESLQKFLPETHMYNQDVFWEMLSRYEEVIMKPIIGAAGKGIFKVTRMRDESFEVFRGDKRIQFDNRTSLNTYIENLLKGKRPYIVQYCIPLAEVNGHTVDFRYITQRKRGEETWVITGKHGKVAAEGRLPTNLRQGGELLTVEETLIKSNIKNLNLAQIMDELDTLSLECSKCLTRKFNRSVIWGYDLAVDVEGKLWIIEANSMPLVNGFRRLKDKTMFNNIQMYKEFNRFKKG